MTTGCELVRQTKKINSSLPVLAAAGPVTIREAARRVNRDVKAVHGDVHALLDAGILQKTRDGLIAFPFDAIRVDVMLRAA